VPNRPVKIYRPAREIVGYITLLSSLLCATLFTLNLSLPYNLNVSILKTASLLSITAFVLINTTTKQHFLLVIAVIASTVAVNYNMNFKTDTNLVFYVSHGISYWLLILLLTLNRIPLTSLKSDRLNLSAFVCATMVLSSYWIYPKLDGKIIEYTIYSFSLLILAVSAVLSRFSKHLVGFGAIFFTIGQQSQYIMPLFRVPDYATDTSWFLIYLGLLFTSVGIILAQNQYEITRKYHHH
jgi:hypothetical protein